MIITADNLTDEQIRELRLAGERELSDAVATGSDRSAAFDILLITNNALHRNLDTTDGNGTWNHWRERIAAALNARAKGGG